jgi:sugar/nucleoside kinase (ribokinase family)
MKGSSNMSIPRNFAVSFGPSRPRKGVGKVLIAGNAVLDITPVISDKENVSFREIFTPGRLSVMDGVDIHAGGACGNTGAAMAYYGSKVILAARSGEDAFGDILAEVIESKGISGRFIRSDETRTSYTIVLAVPGSDRIFLHDPGAGDLFCPDDLKTIDLSDIRLFHFGYPPLMRKMFENEGSELVRMFSNMKRNPILTSLDMAMVSPNSPAGKANWKEILRKTLPFVDFFLPSLEETCMYLDPERYRSWVVRGADGSSVPQDLSVTGDIAPLADELIAMGAGVVLIKCGEFGMYFRTASPERLTETAKLLDCDPAVLGNQAGFARALKAEHVVSANGAGDAAIAGFLAAMMEKRPFEECILLALASGSCSVTGYDAVSALIPFDEMLARIKSGWERNNAIRD